MNSHIDHCVTNPNKSKEAAERHKFESNNITILFIASKFYIYKAGFCRRINIEHSSSRRWIFNYIFNKIKKP